MLMLSVELRNIGRALLFPFGVPAGESNSTDRVNLEIECILIDADTLLAVLLSWLNQLFPCKHN
ncbi:hypothetical protein [Coleofasciculus sp.]|uniref:hypothetical protein n=1 Tax=Coleofasciculus sp. TaxID=3100458 RepID=UPI003A33EA33